MEDAAARQVKSNCFSAFSFYLVALQHPVRVIIK
jgi:hypothetical protein